MLPCEVWEIGDPATRHVQCFVAKNRFLQTPRLPNFVSIIYLYLIIRKCHIVRARRISTDVFRHPPILRRWHWFMPWLQCIADIPKISKQNEGVRCPSRKFFKKLSSFVVSKTSITGKPLVYSCMLLCHHIATASHPLIDNFIINYICWLIFFELSKTRGL